MATTLTYFVFRLITHTLTYKDIFNETPISNGVQHIGNSKDLSIKVYIHIFCRKLNLHLPHRTVIPRNSFSTV